MKARLVLIVLSLLAAYLLLQVAWTGWCVLRSKTLEPVAVGERDVGDEGSPFVLFVTGDSVGSGYGASSFETSLAGRVARHFARGRTVAYRNTSVSGAKMADLEEQSLPEGKADLVLLSAGSNDLLHFTGADDLRESARKVLARYAPHVPKGRLVLIGPGVVHRAGADPLVVRPFHEARRPAYVEALRAACDEVGAVYVDPAVGMAGKSDREIAETVSDVDHFHLSDAGHAWWAGRVLAELGER